MTRTLLTAALILGIVVPASAEGPLAAAASRELSAMQLAPPANGGGSKGMIWGGIGMIAAGGTLAALGATALKNETCGAAVIGVSVIAGCVEETNKALLWTGIGIAGGGATLTAFGLNRNVQIGVRSIAYKVRF